MDDAQILPEGPGLADTNQALKILPNGKTDYRKRSKSAST